MSVCLFPTQVLEAPGVYVFGELLEMPNVQELSNGPNAPYFNALNLFAYGIYQDFKCKCPKWELQGYLP